MLTIDDLNLDKKLSIGIALSFSSDALPLFEAEYPDDLRPREAIESAIKWFSNPCKEARDDASNAGYATGAAADAYAYAAGAAADAYAVADANAGYAAGYAASAAAGYAAYAAANAGYAVVYAGYAAANAGSAAANAAAAYAASNCASNAAKADKERYVHDRIVKILPLILEYKIENEQSFDNAEKVLKYLNDEDKGAFLFNLDILR